MGRITTGHYTCVPRDYAGWIADNFVFMPHTCADTCICKVLGCSKHWQWKDGNYPREEPLARILGSWKAFRKTGSQAAFSSSFEKVLELVQPRELRDKTVLCRWDKDQIALVYDQAKQHLNGSTMLTTKTLHFLVPELFVVLDREKVFGPFRKEMRASNGNSLLPSNIDGVGGNAYAELLSHVRTEVSTAIKKNTPYTVNKSPIGVISSALDFRLVSPLWLGVKRLPNTLCMVVDDILKDEVSHG